MTQVAVGKEIWKTGIQEICMVAGFLCGFLASRFLFLLPAFERILPG
jgi:hypothetical protein